MLPLPRHARNRYAVLTCDWEPHLIRSVAAKRYGKRMREEVRCRVLLPNLVMLVSGEQQSMTFTHWTRCVPQCVAIVVRCNFSSHPVSKLQLERVTRGSSSPHFFCVPSVPHRPLPSPPHSPGCSASQGDVLLESAAARICGETGTRLTRTVFVRILNVGCP